MTQVATERRQFERFSLPAMFTTVHVTRVVDGAMCVLDGHAYDISAGGIRVELDDRLELGEMVNVELTLPLHLADEPSHVTFLGRAVWSNDTDDDPGPVRSAIEIFRFFDQEGRDRLLALLGSGHLYRAA